MSFGAPYEDWHKLDIEAGLTADLLPVVSNPNAPISPDSKMKGIGKTPSIYNARGQVVGIPKWTERQSTGHQIAKWSSQEDYGICIQTRLVRALDIDIDDVRGAAAVMSLFLQALNLNADQMPVRTRSNSGKRLLAFKLVGDFQKRSFKTATGLVEFLANGQQFIASGTHPSGVRYSWRGGTPEDFIEITTEQWEHAWDTIVREFASEPERRASSRTGSGLPEGYETTDGVAAFLALNWPTYGEQGGKLYCLCPWKSGHSVDSGETETCWLLAGTNGYAQGHFECLHASCTARGDAEFFTEVGYCPATAEDFDDLTEGAEVPEALEASDPAAGSAPSPVAPKASSPKVQSVMSLPLPGFVRDKSGAIEPLLPNVAKALAAPQACGVMLRHDVFRDELMLASPDGMNWRPFTDADAVELRIGLEAIRFKPVGREMMRDALTKIGADQRFDSAIAWLEGLLPWDGVDRVSRLYPDYFKTKDDAYTQACGRYVMSAHAARVMEPGAKADMVPVLTGPQGYLKSTGIAALAPHEEAFTELDLEVKDNDLSRKMRGKLIGELGELQGLNTRAGEAIRAWVVRRFEEWTPKYQERVQRFYRRLLFHGTTNDDQFLTDPTGERRWLPMAVLGLVDAAAIAADRDQLWAQGLAMWREHGVMWEEAERLAKLEHPDFKAEDSLHDQIATWVDEVDLDGSTPRSRSLTTIEVLVEACGYDRARIKKGEQMRVGPILTALGFERVVKWVGGKTVKRWEATNDDLA